MNTTTKTANYTEAQEKEILTAIPFDYDKAKLLAESFGGKKPMSVVAKVKRMESEARKKAEADDTVKLPIDGGTWYIKKPDYVSKAGKPAVKKVDRQRNIADMLGIAFSKVENWNTVRAIEEIEAAIVLLINPKTVIEGDGITGVSDVFPEVEGESLEDEEIFELEDAIEGTSGLSLGE